MELGLSLGDASKKLCFLKGNNNPTQQNHTKKSGSFDFSMTLGLNSGNQDRENDEENEEDELEDDQISVGDGSDDNQGDQSPNLQLNLLPLAPVPLQISSLPWSSDNGSSENGSSGNIGLTAVKGVDVNRPPAAEEVSSANSLFQMDFGRMYRNSGNGKMQLSGNKRDFEAAGNDGVEAERASSRASDDDDNGVNARKKLRLSKEQSAFLEESFKEHNTLNPKQKLALAKQLNLRPRQVEVWFQNRRARTKLKQTEVDCEYLKRCCETLTDENRRLHKELQELRALKTSNPFYMQLPATTLTMCPSCERVAPATTAVQPTVTVAASGNGKNAEMNSVHFPLTRPRFYPFAAHPNQPAAS